MSAAASMEARLRALEAVLRESSATTTADAPNSRLYALEAKLDSLTTTTEQGSADSSGSHSNFKQLWQESDALLMELDPGSALTHQQQIAAPILYRRAAVVASAESLQRDMQTVLDILTLLSVDQPQMISHNSDSAPPLSEMQVTKAPLLVDTAPPSPADQARVVRVETSLHETAVRVQSAAARMDRLVAAYLALVAAVSEKMVLADEAIVPTE